MWKLVFNSKTRRGTGCNRKPREGEFVIERKRENCLWFNIYPDRYQYVNGTFSEVPNWESDRLLKEKLQKLDKDLSDIDKEVQEADKQPFLFNGVSYYPDTEFIQGIFSVLHLLPSNYTEVWKTAEKEEDGLKNKKVTLDKAGITGLALAYLQFKKNNWLAGEIRKDALKTAFLEG